MLAEQLVGVARERRKQRMDTRERIVDGLSAALFTVAAVAIALLLPSDRSVDPVLVAALVIGYAAVSRVRFEFGDGYVVPEPLLFVPLLLLGPLPLVPLLAASAALLGRLPDLIRADWHAQRWITAIGDSWFCLGPVLVVAALAPGEPTLGNAEVYGLAFLAQLSCDFGWALARDRLIGQRLPLATLLRNYSGSARVDAVLSPLAFMIALTAADQPLALLVIAPFLWLLETFARDRQARYTAALELHRAYRGTVMLLTDVVEHNHAYTAEHSRSIVDLVHVVADEMGVSVDDRQELEFGALLHDVGKIAIPKEILDKPSSLSADELEVIKTHTIEGQFLLDRIGGLLGRVGEIVRSCHERWDGHGYPDGLAGEEIPLAARIVFACDAYSSMTTDRVYRAAMSKEEALQELRGNAGTQFDPAVISILAKVVEQGEPVLTPVTSVRAVLAGARVPKHIGAAT
jgi:HD-GYP domain-containing protein (c-di-GMP phosphodiesterase class II)